MSQVLRYISPHKLEWHDAPSPVLRSAYDAIVRPVASTTCDLDVMIIRGQTPFQGPFDIGHECIAEVVEMGDGARRFFPGQLVIVSWHISCGSCHRCVRGLPNTCAHHPRGAMFGMSVGGEWGGLFSDRVRVPFANASLLPLPAGLDPTHLASLSDNIPFGYDSRCRTCSATRVPMCWSWEAWGRWRSSPWPSPKPRARVGSTTSMQTRSASRSPRDWAPTRSKGSRRAARELCHHRGCQRKRGRPALRHPVDGTGGQLLQRGSAIQHATDAAAGDVHTRHPFLHRPRSGPAQFRARAQVHQRWSGQARGRDHRGSPVRTVTRGAARSLDEAHPGTTDATVGAVQAGADGSLISRAGPRPRAATCASSAPRRTTRAPHPRRDSPRAARRGT